MGNRAQFNFADDDGTYLELNCSWDKEEILSEMVEIIERRNGEFLFEHVSEIMKLQGLDFGGNDMASQVTFLESRTGIEVVLPENWDLTSVGESGTITVVQKKGTP